MATYDYVVTLGADCSDIAEQLLKSYKDGQKIADQNAITVRLSANPKEFEAELKKIKDKNPSITTNLRFEYDASGYEKKMKTLEAITKSKSKKAGEVFSEQMQASINKIDLGKLLETHGKKQLTPANIKPIVESLKKELGTIDFSNNNLNFDDLYKYAEKLEEIRSIMNQVNTIASTKKTKAWQNGGYTDEDFKWINDFYKDANSKLVVNGSKMLNQLTSDAEQAQKVIMDAMSSFADNLNGNSRTVFENATEDIKKLENELDETEQKIARITKQLSKSNNTSNKATIKGLQSDINKWRTNGRLDDDLATKIVSDYEKLKNQRMGTIDKTIFSNLKSTVDEAREYAKKDNSIELQNELTLLQRQREELVKQLEIKKAISAENNNTTAQGDGNSKNASVPTTLEADIEQGLTEIQNKINQSGKKINIDTALNIDVDNEIKEIQNTVNQSGKRISIDTNLNNPVSDNVSDDTSENKTKKKTEELKEQASATEKVIQKRKELNAEQNKTSEVIPIPASFDIDVKEELSRIQTEVKEGEKKVNIPATLDIDIDKEITEFQNAAKESGKKINIDTALNIDVDNEIKEIQNTVNQSGKRISIDTNLNNPVSDNVSDDTSENKTKKKTEELKEQASATEKVIQKRKELNAEQNKTSEVSTLELANNNLREAQIEVDKLRQEYQDLCVVMDNAAIRAEMVSDCISNSKKYNFDMLEQAQKQFNEQNNLDKAAMYYGLYRHSGGKEPFIDKENINRTNELIAHYNDLLKAQKEYNNIVTQLNKKNEEVKAQEDNIKALKKEIELQKNRIEILEKATQEAREQAKVVEQTAKNTQKSLIGMEQLMAGIKNVDSEMNSNASATTSQKTVSKKATASTPLNSGNIQNNIDNKNKVTISAKLDINVPTEIQEIQTKVNQSGKKISIDTELNKPAINTNMEAEITQIDALTEAVKKAEEAVNNKTQSFKKEASIVAAVIPEETRHIGKLVSAIKNVESTIDSVNNAISALSIGEKLVGELAQADIKINELKTTITSLRTNLPDIPEVKFDNKNIKKIDDTTLTSLNRLKTKLEELNKVLSDKSLSNNLQDLATSLTILGQTHASGKFDFDTDGLKNIIKIATESNSKRILDFAENIEKLSNAIIDLRRCGGNVTDLSGLKISKSHVNNMEQMAYALSVVNESLKSFTKSGRQTLKTLKDITAQSSALKDLNAILKAPKNKVANASQQVKNARKNADKNDNKQSQSSVQKALQDQLKAWKNIQSVREEIEKIDTNDINGLKILNTKRIAYQQEYLEATRILHVNKNSYNQELQRAKLEEQRLKTNKQINKFKIGNIDIDKVLHNGDNVLANFEKKANQSDEYRNKVLKLSQALEQLRSIENSRIKSKILSQDEINNITNAVKEIQLLSNEIRLMPSHIQCSDEISRHKELDKIAEYMKKNTRMSKEFNAELNALMYTLRTGGDSVDVKNVHIQFERIKDKIREAKQEGIAFFDIFKNKAVYGFAARLAQYYLSFYDFIRYARYAFDAVREFDTALTEMTKVSDESISSLKNLQKSTFDLADGVGTTALDLQKSIADWMRVGETMQEATQSAQDANVLFRVSEFEDVTQATDALVAMSAAFKDLEKSRINDVLNEIGNNFAISTDELASSLQRSAGTLATLGTTLEEAAALTVAGNTILQDPDSVAAGLRTIELRMVGTTTAKDELQMIGEDVDDFVVQTESKLRESIMNLTKVASNGYKGFDILDENGNYKSFYEKMLGLSEIYEELQEQDKKLGNNSATALIELIAGKNRSAIAGAILSSPDILKSAYESALNSAGSAQEELNKYLDSMDGKIQKLSNQLQEFWSVLLDTDVLKGAIDGLTTILGLATDFVDTFDALSTIGMGMGALLGIKNVGTVQLY